MKIGTQVVAPDGWRSLPKGVLFHFLRSDPYSSRVFLVRFSLKGANAAPHANLVCVPRSEFEEGVQLDAIVAAQQQATRPPWLIELEGIDLWQIDQYRVSTAKITHRERVENRYLIIAPAVRDFRTVLAAEDPQAELSRRARLCSPAQNESRFRLWWLTYLCFGYDMWALLPPFHRIGHWDRFAHTGKKLGAPSKAYGMLPAA